MKKIKFIIYTVLLVSFFGCEDCECIEDGIDPQTDICEGAFYFGALYIAPDGSTPLTFERFNQPVTNPLNKTNLETQNVNLFGEFYSHAFGAYDKNTDRYAFFYLLDDSSNANTLYVADTNPLITNAIQTEKDQAAPVFLNGNLYTINLLSAAPNVEFEILQLDQVTGLATQITASLATVDGPFFNATVSSATNGIDTLYFLGIKTLVSYNVITNTVLVQDLTIPFDSGIETALSGLEYRTATNELIAIHHKLNNPAATERLVSIDIASGQVAFLYNIEANLGTENNGDIEFLTNSTTYSECEDTYYITEIVDPETSESPNSFLLAIDLTNNTLTEIQTTDFLYGLTIDENP